jgi:hypothetical protein
MQHTILRSALPAMTVVATCRQLDRKVLERLTA